MPARMLLLLLFVPLLSGCWDRVEMNDISFFMASGLDLSEDGRLKTTIQVPIPAGGGSGGESGKASTGTFGKTYYAVSAIGTNIFDAERQIQQKNSRHFFKGQRRVVFIGEALARKGIQDILDNYARDPRSRMRTYLVVAKGSEASKLLQNDHPTERIPAEEVRELERSGVGTSVTFRDFLMTQARDGIVPVTGAIELVPPAVDPSNGAASKFNMFRLSSTAVFKDYKLIGYLNDIETRSLRWIKNESKEEYFGDSLPGLSGNIGIVMNDIKSKVNVIMNGNRAQVRIQLRGTGTINESNVDLKLSRLSNMTIIEKRFGELVARQTLQTVKKAQTEWRADIFGFGLHLHQFHYRTWKKVRSQWDTIFSEADVVVTADISLRRSGIIGNSFEHHGAEKK
ncbi:Ger(x)C family spore germination protein [Paenibacillus glycinis]|uniref:Ger(X)C family spore germination protein n=1 Tax=Paenibacillus glycinis TaxID=2697035 RepID=A0ABW9XZ85_9BACL|nr:Ger(x)C family spore germination protein [Paenibacillus glycinis]NBD28020.1 Ger(x)C family spore germination protein [Paenibacillus glycinis]